MIWGPRTRIASTLDLTYPWNLKILTSSAGGTYADNNIRDLGLSNGPKTRCTPAAIVCSTRDELQTDMNWGEYPPTDPNPALTTPLWYRDDGTGMAAPHCCTTHIRPQLGAAVPVLISISFGLGWPVINASSKCDSNMGVINMAGVTFSPSITSNCKSP